MKFPDSQRVVYKKNPLKEVVCQLIFPPILKIGAQDPVDFQEALRRDYPKYQAVNVGMPEIPPELQSMGFRLPATKPTINHQFASDDDFWHLSLSNTAIALSCRKYERWELFRQRLVTSLELLQRIYEPVAYTRIGLRYCDVIDRSTLGLAGVSWTELLKDHIAGELRLLRDFEGDFEALLTQFQAKLDIGESKVRVVHGTADVPGVSDSCYVIDGDFFTEQRLTTDDAIERLDEYNKEAGRLFRWIISDRLRDALQPTDLPAGS